MKTIKDAVINLEGKLPRINNIFRGYCVSEGRLYFCGIISAIGTIEQFESCAKRLGYINGYQFGKEYPTNGKRPELPDDVLVQVYFEGEWSKDSHRADTWSWIKHLTKFRITDPRYKPVDELVKEGIDLCNKIEEKLTEVDNNWHERGLLPVAGTKVELWIGGQYKEDVEFLCRRKFDLVFWRFTNDSVDSASTPTAEVRPIRTEREKVIEAAVTICAAMKPNTVERMEALYNAGMLVLPQDSGDTKD